MNLDAVIFGGGAAGLWLLDDLVRAAQSVVLLEAGELGGGQTIASQGIIHGGLKYTLQGMLSRSAANIREMPVLWRECLSGDRGPDLCGTRVRAECCYLWRTESVASRLGMIGARVGLRVTAESVDEEQRPSLLSGCPGTVARMAEQVISPASFLEDLAGRHWNRILKIDRDSGCEIVASTAGHIERIDLTDSQSGRRLTLCPQRVVFAAGAGNAGLRKHAGLSSESMQRRPLHMAMVRGNLPPLNGHCVDGAKTRITVTSDVDSSGQTVWQIGGQLAEDGVAMDEPSLVARTRDELAAVIPGIRLDGIECATYRVDRAEGRTTGGGRPETFQILRDGNTLTAWPTKLALVPALSRQIVASLGGTRKDRSSNNLEVPADWPRPRVGLPPWETADSWHEFDTRTGRRNKAA